MTQLVTHIPAGPSRFDLRLGTDVVPDDGWNRRTLHTAAHLHGPTGVLQGGLAAGVLAEIARGCDPHGAPLTRIEARLHAPTPLDADVVARCRQTSAGHADTEIRLDGRLLVSGHVEVAGRDAAPNVGDLVELARVVLPEPPVQWTFPNCVVCGPANPHGLALLPGWHTEATIVTGFLPGEDLADERGRLHPLVVAAVLDCPSAWATMPSVRARGDAGALLAGYELTMFADAPLGVPLRTVARFDQADGRKLRARAALVDEDEIVYAVASALHIAVATMPSFATSD